MLLLSAISHSSRPPKLQKFHRKLGVLRENTNGPFFLSDADSSYNWPQRGIYIFFSPESDPVTDPVEDWRIARIGTVGDSANSSSTIWERLRAHRGTMNSSYGELGGNHRGSVFRKHVGRSIIEGSDLEYPHWGTPHRNLPDDVSTKEIRTEEHELEQRVSEYIRNLPFLVIDIPGEPASQCERAVIEANLIALVSHARRTNPKLKTDEGMTSLSPRAEISKTGLWNIQHVNSFYSDDIIQRIEPYVNNTEPIKE